MDGSGSVNSMTLFTLDCGPAQARSRERLPMNPNVGQCVSSATRLVSGRTGGAGETHCPTLAPRFIRNISRQSPLRTSSTSYEKHSLRPRIVCGFDCLSYR
jgi:hypothetical protein